jgi:hypothetical protein
MVEIGDSINESQLTPYNRTLAQELTARAEAQQRILEREVKSLKTLFKNQDL